MPITDKELRERRYVHRYLTLAMLAEFERVCAWLETQRYHASYYPKTWIISTDARTSRIRRYIKAIFWSTGHGWRNHKDWRERIATVRAEITPNADESEATDG